VDTQLLWEIESVISVKIKKYMKVPRRADMEKLINLEGTNHLMTKTVTMTQIFDELKRIERKMVTRKDVAKLQDTIEVMSNPGTMRQISASLEDIKQGRVKDIKSVHDLLK